MSHDELPVETLEIIIDFIPDSPGKSLFPNPLHKRTLLACALVSRAWNAAARRCLLQQYYPRGQVDVLPNSLAVLVLADIFQSPFRTIEPSFVKVLRVNVKAAQTSRLRDALIQRMGSFTPPRSFFVALSEAFDSSVFSSLSALVYEVIPVPSHDLGFTSIPCCGTSASQSIFSQIESLRFNSPDRTLFAYIIHAIRLCPFVEEVAAYGSGYVGFDRSLYRCLPPPNSLRKLSLDMKTMFKLLEWFMSCEPFHTTLSSLSIPRFEWYTQSTSPELRELLDRVGPNLEELELGVSDVEYEDDVQPGTVFFIFYF